MRIGGLYWHWHNESCIEDERGKRVRWRFPWHGRLWVELGRKHASGTRSVRVEWVCWQWKGLAFEVEMGPNDDAPGIGGHVSLLWMAFFWQLSTPRLRDWTYSFPFYRDYVYSIAFWTLSDDITIRFSWGGNPMAWSSGDPWYWAWHLNLPDAIFGRTKYQSSLMEKRTITVALPEDFYRGDVKVHYEEWRRPRWPWVWRRRRSATVELSSASTGKKGIPVPGKGENSWDCGEDAIYSMGSAHTTPELIICDVAAAVMSRRRRYGGENWRPRNSAPVTVE